MKVLSVILSFMALIAWPLAGFCGNGNRELQFDFYGNTVSIPYDNSINIPCPEAVTEQSIDNFYNAINEGKYNAVTETLLAFKKEHKLDDWLYYQLIRKTAQQIAPKAEN